MRDVSSKYLCLRTAKAVASVRVSPATIEALRSGNVPKADPIGVAKIAGIQAAKNTSLLIPYCHQVPLDHVSVEITIEKGMLNIVTEVKAIWKTGVEMEALTAASASALTLYDMLKPIDGSMEIVAVRLLEKTGGKSGSKISGEGYKAAVLVLSDSVSRGTKKDRSGQFLVEYLRQMKFDVAESRVLPDEVNSIRSELENLADARKIDLILTTGGTGEGPRDVAPEATVQLLERRLPGVEETLRRFGQDRLATSMLSRGVAGTRGSSLIINLPGSLRAVEDGVSVLFPAILHIFKMMEGQRHD